MSFILEKGSRVELCVWHTKFILKILLLLTWLNHILRLLVIILATTGSFDGFSMRICMNTFNYEQGSQAGNDSIWHTLYYELGFQRYYMVFIFQNWHQVKVLFICYPVKKFKARMQTIRLSSLTMR